MPTVWAVLALLVILVLGIISRLTKLLKPQDIAPLNKLIFMFCIPCLAFKIMATHGVQTLDWTFVLLFLSIRASAAVIAAIFTFATKGDFADFAVHYLAPTWIDVITFGVPVLTAMFGEEVGQHYPVLAAFSSFIFELPVILLAFQIYSARREILGLDKQIETPSTPPTNNLDNIPSSPSDDDDTPVIDVYEEEDTAVNKKDIPKRKLPWGRILANVGKRLLCTPPLIAIILGIIYGSFKWKMPVLLGTILTNLGNCVTPVATFCVGIFITDGKPFRRVWRKTIIYMLLKIVGMPLLAMGLIFAFGFKPPVSEVALVIACLPLAFPAFTFAKEYGRGEDVMATCISVGTVLMLPVVIFWAYCADWVFGDHSSSSSSSFASSGAAAALLSF